ncbi:multidrug resistance protein cdr1 [Seiridium cupressi]
MSPASQPGSSRNSETTQSADNASRAEPENLEHSEEFNSSRVAALARRLTQASARSEPHNVNPFLSSSPWLDPQSPQFDAKKWGQALLQAFAEDPAKYPRQPIGVSWRSLSVYGYGSGVDYQKDILNVLWRAPLMVRDWISGRQQKIHILRDFDGLVQPGEMLLVLGRPGSGVSTLLKTIAGQVHGLHLDPKSDFNYQGIQWDVMHSRFRGEIVYQAETDVHFPQLTVGQTLQFAALARTPKNRLPGVSRKTYAEYLRDVVMAIFGISHTVNTKVGNDYIRGVSGGERKRVSIAEATLNLSAIQCWDNSTRGLDSAAALEFARTLKLSTDLAGTSAIVAIYQASQPAYDARRQIFFGHISIAKKYFTDMGYHCPHRQTTADFLTSLTNPAERVTQPGLETRVPRTPDEFAEAWKRSGIYKELQKKIDLFEVDTAMENNYFEPLKKARKLQQASLTRNWSPYTLSIPMQIGLCMQRGFQRLAGDKTFFIVTIAANFVISVVLGSIYYNLDPVADSLNSRCILLYFAILFNALSSALEIFSLYQQRPIVEKQARYASYHPFAEAISSVICDLPSKVLSTIAFNIPLYFMANLRREPGAFFVFLLFGFTCTFTMSMILRTIGQTSKTVQQALTPAAIFILGLVIYTGFILPTQNMQGWLRWINYLDPIAYAYESLVANELSSRQFPCASFVPMGPSYANSTPTERACSVAGALPGQDFVDGDLYMNTSFGYYHSHIWRRRNFGILIAYIIFFMSIYVLAAEYLSLDPSKGEVLLFRRNKLVTSTERKPPHDEESGGSQVHDRHHTSQQTQQTEGRIQKQDSIFHWNQICYDITIKGQPRRILDHVDGWVKPGTLTALMGASGAGKTTLLDVLADRVTMGVVTGDMLVDGRPKNMAFQRQTGLNVEQRKRLTIGVELAAKPDLLLFLDEPTSGLDSQTAWSIATLIRKLSDSGQAILCTIHQPSAILFQQFDRLLLLAKGGRTVYFGDLGENSKTLTSYFERHGADPCSLGENPAEWMLRVIGAAPGAHTDLDWPEIWRSSSECAAVRNELNELAAITTTGRLTSREGDEVSYYAAPFSTQLVAVTKRVFEQYWRTPSYIYAKLILCGGTSLFIGVSFYQAELSISGLQHQMFSIFMLLVIFAFLVYQRMPHFIVQRQQYEGRERSSRVYSWYVFMLANMSAELPWNTLAALLVFFPFYYLVGMNNNAVATDSVTERGGLMFFITWSFMMFESTFADMVIAGVDTAEVGAVIALLMFALSLIFCGVMVPLSSLPGFWHFMYRVSPFTYIIGCMLGTGVANHEVTCSALELLQFQPAQGQTCGQYMEAYMQLAGGAVYNPDDTSNCQFCSLANTNVFLTSVDISYGQRWRDLGLLWAYTAFNIVATLALFWLARVPKRGLAKRLTKF